MKKILAALIIFAFIMAIAASCKSSEKCPAYGEKKKYQVEKAY